MLDYAGRAGFDGVGLMRGWPMGNYPSSDQTERIAALKRLYNTYGLDSSHFDLFNGSTGKPHELLQRIGVENIGYVHFTDTDGTIRDGGTSKHLGAGDGHIDVEATFKTLKDGGFRGWVMVDTWQIPDPYDASTKGLAAIRHGMSAI